MGVFTASCYQAFRDATSYQDGINRIDAAIFASANRTAACFGITPAEAIASLSGNFTVGTECIGQIVSAANWFINSGTAALGDLKFKGTGC